MAYAAAQHGAFRCRRGYLVLSSGPGLGKTHLTQAVGQALCEASNRSNPKVEYLTAEEFSSCFVQALQSRTVDRFKGRFRDVDLLLLEDVHFLQGKEKMQDEVLSTIKSLQEKGSRVVLTSSFAPCELRNVDNSLVSRFCSGFLAGIEKPDASTRRRILQEKARQNNALLSDTVVDVLTERLTGDIRQLESCVHNLLLKAKLLGCTISVEMAQEILAQYSLDDPFVDVDSIIRKVCEGFGLSPEQLASRSRKQNLVVARNTIFYLARKHTELSRRTSATNFPAGIPRCSRALLRLSASASRSGVRLPARWLCWSSVRFPPALSKDFDFINPSLRGQP
ncbi:MAG: DnaA ATPase domain-containing protein [Bilophila wadsworthia]